MYFSFNPPKDSNNPYYQSWFGLTVYGFVSIVIAIDLAFELCIFTLIWPHHLDLDVLFKLFWTLVKIFCHLNLFWSCYLPTLFYNAYCIGQYILEFLVLVSSRLIYDSTAEEDQKYFRNFWIYLLRSFVVYYLSCSVVKTCQFMILKKREKYFNVNPESVIDV